MIHGGATGAKRVIACRFVDLAHQRAIGKRGHILCGMYCWDGGHFPCWFDYSTGINGSVTGGASDYDWYGSWSHKPGIIDLLDNAKPTI